MQTALEQSEKIVTHDFIRGGNVVSWSLVHANNSRTIRKDCYTRLHKTGRNRGFNSRKTPPKK